MRGTPSRKRPWLAALLGLAVTGLGHVYLRRWVRAFGWFAMTYAATLLFVPPDAVTALVSGETIDPLAIAPPLALALASAVDAYLVARRGNAVASAGLADEAGRTCPNCGRELDPDLDFCPWCSMELGVPCAEDG